MFYTKIPKEKYIEIRDDLKEEFYYFSQKWNHIGKMLSNLSFNDIDEGLEDSDDEILVGVPDISFENVFLKDYFGSNGIDLYCDKKGKISWRVLLPNLIEDLTQLTKIRNRLGEINDIFNDYSEFVENIIDLIL